MTDELTIERKIADLFNSVADNDETKKAVMALLEAVKRETKEATPIGLAVLNVLDLLSSKHSSAYKEVDLQQRMIATSTMRQVKAELMK